MIKILAYHPLLMTSAKLRFPRQIRFIIGNEACERFSFYGMRSILVVFMTGHLLMNQADSKTVYHLFVSACYLLPLFGALISDRFFGKYNTILYLSLFYCFGHLTLALWEGQTGLYLGLALIALGSGGIKPCVAAFVGDQFTEENKPLLQKVYDLFYFSVNFGSFFATLLIPVLLAKVGVKIAFGLPGILMGISTLIFWLGRKTYINVPPARDTHSAGFLTVLFYAFSHLGDKKAGSPFLDIALQKYSRTDVEAAKATLDIFKIFVTVSIFWSLFDQQGASWTLQAQKMNLEVLGMHLEAAQLQAMNPILVMILIPLFTYGLYPLIERLGFSLTPLRKISIGMVLAALAFISVGIFQTELDQGRVISVAWQFIPYFIITASEVMISITGLEFAYSQAPRSMKSTIMSFWLLTIFAGNLLDAIVSKLNVFEGALYFFFFAALMFGVALIFIGSAIRYRVRNFDENGDLV